MGQLQPEHEQRVNTFSVKIGHLFKIWPLTLFKSMLAIVVEDVIRAGDGQSGMSYCNTLPLYTCFCPIGGSFRLD